MMRCPACGAQPWYILRGRCHDCGYTVATVMPIELPVAL